MSSPPIKNIYYMLSYVFRPLEKDDYKKVSTEDFDNVLDLLSRIIVLGLDRLIKRGFFRDYNRKTETSPAIRGKINLSESIKTLSFMRKQLNFSYSEFSLDNYLNQIIKTTLIYFIKSNIEKDTKTDIKRILLYFSNVGTLDVRFIDWDIKYYRHNQEYEMIIRVCYLAINGLLQTEEDGTFKLMNFNEKFMEKLYEEFIFNYYKKEYKKILSVTRPHLKWPLNNLEDNMDNFLPRMKTDIVLSSKRENKFLIIDAKYYLEIFTNYHNKSSIRSNHLYQIFTYVKSKEFELRDKPHDVSGMLLYAGTDEIIQPDVDYMMDGNRISVKILDLDCDFQFIKEQLDNIVNSYFIVE